MGRGSKLTKSGILVLTASLLGAVSAVAQTTTVAPTTAVAQTPAAAQLPNSSTRGKIGLTTQVDIDNNSNLDRVSPGTTVDVAEVLSFSYTSETRTQIFDISANTALRFSKLPDGSTDFSADDPTFNVRYFRDGSNADLNFSAQYRESSVSSAYDADPTIAVFIVNDSGSLTAAKAAVTLRTGLNAPLGFQFDASYDAIDYTGTADPNLFDTDTTVLGVQANLRFSPVMLARAGVDWTDYNSSDATATDTETTNYTLGLTHDIRSALAINAVLGFQETETSRSGATTRRDGFFGSVNLTQGRPNGIITAGIGFDNGGLTDQTFLSLGRTLDLPDGTLSAALTLTDVQGTGLQYGGNVAYTKQLPTGNINVNLDRTLSTNASDEDVLFTSLGLGYLQQINSVSDVNLSLNVSRSEDGGAGAFPTTSRATLSAAYSRVVTQDWNMSVGYRHRRYSSTTVSGANSDSVFFSLSRSIDFGF